VYSREKEKQEAFVSVSMNESQENFLRKAAHDWGISMSAVLRRLIAYALRRIFVERSLTLECLLKQYQAMCENTTFTDGFSVKNEKKTFKTSVRLLEEDYKKLNVLAEHGFYLPGELVSILIELFVAGVIFKSDIWK
jgi:hypothetical protein